MGGGGEAHASRSNCHVTPKRVDQTSSPSESDDTKDRFPVTGCALHRVPNRKSMVASYLGYSTQETDFVNPVLFVLGSSASEGALMSQLDLDTSSHSRGVFL